MKAYANTYLHAPVHRSVGIVFDWGRGFATHGSQSRVRSLRLTPRQPGPTTCTRAYLALQCSRVLRRFLQESNSAAVAEHSELPSSLRAECCTEGQDVKYRTGNRFPPTGTGCLVSRASITYGRLVSRPNFLSRHHCSAVAWPSTQRGLSSGRWKWK